MAAEKFPAKIRSHCPCAIFEYCVFLNCYCPDTHQKWAKFYLAYKAHFRHHYAQIVALFILL